MPSPLRDKLQPGNDEGVTTPWGTAPEPAKAPGEQRFIEMDQRSVGPCREFHLGLDTRLGALCPARPRPWHPAASSSTSPSLKSVVQSSVSGGSWSGRTESRGALGVWKGLGVGTASRVTLGMFSEGSQAPSLGLGTPRAPGQSRNGWNALTNPQEGLVEQEGQVRPPSGTGNPRPRDSGPGPRRLRIQPHQRCPQGSQINMAGMVPAPHVCLAAPPSLPSWNP